MVAKKVSNILVFLILSLVFVSRPLTLEASTPIEPTGYSYPIPVYQGVDLSAFPVFNVANFSASGSHATLICNGSAGSTTLLCNGSGHFNAGQGLRVASGGGSSAETGRTSTPNIVVGGNGSSGHHTNCYIVDIVDPLNAVSHPSPSTCVSNQPSLSVAGVWNSLSTTFDTGGEYPGPSPTFLWYVSQDGGPYRFLNAAKFTANAVDVGQRPGPKRGWPDPLPASNPDISKSEDLFSTVTAVQGNSITIADPLLESVTGTVVEHDDTVAVENAILAASAAGGGTIIFGAGTFNLKRPAFNYVVNNSYAYPPFTYNLSLDPWWAAFFYLYIPNGSQGNINFQGAGRSTTLVTPADHGGVAALFAIGTEARQGDPNEPILPIEDVPSGSTQVTLAPSATVTSLKPGDDVFLYYGSYESTPDIDTGSTYPDMHHYSELNSVAAVLGNVVTLAYPTTKHYHNDGASSWGMHKMAVTPHNIELQDLNIKTSDPITSPGVVIGMLVNDVQIQGTLSLGAFGGGFKRGVTIENSSWTFGQGTGFWGQLDEYDQFTDLAFINNAVAGYAAPGIEGESGMAKLYATEGTSQVLFFGNRFNHVSVYADQTNQFYVQGNSFTDGIVTVGIAYCPQVSPYIVLAHDDPSFLSFNSQNAASVDHNSFNFTTDFTPPWVIRLGDFTDGAVTHNVISYTGNVAPQFLIGSFNGVVSNNLVTVKVPSASEMIALLPDQSPLTATSAFTVQNNTTNAQRIFANIAVMDPGYTDVGQVCVKDNVVTMSSGVALVEPTSVSNRRCGAPPNE